MPASSRLRSACSALALLCLGHARGQQPSPPITIQVPPQPQVPAQSQPAGPILTLQANSRAVLLDVVVTDSKGHPVHGLKQGDFRVFEDGAPQTIASLEEHHPATAAASPSQAPNLGPNTWTNFKPRPPANAAAATVFLLDALDTPLPAQSYARDQLLSYFKSMQPGTEVAIFQLDTQLRLVQGFTSDPEVLTNAVRNRARPLLTALPNTPGYVAQAMRMDSLRSAMQSLGAYLQTWPGRKNLIWFTAHIPRYAYNDGSALGGALHDGEGFLFDYSKATDALVLGQVSVYPIDSRGLQTDPSFDASQRRGPSPRSSAAFNTRQFFEHSDLDEVAEATGGKAFYNTNGIRQVVSEVVDAGSAYYTLSYYPENKKWDGSYRKLKLDVSDSLAPQALQLEYRRGYYAVRDARGLARPGQPAARSGQSAQAAGRVQLTHSAPPDQTAFASAMQLGAVDPAGIIFEVHVDANPTIEKFAKQQPLPPDNLLEPKYRDHPFRNLDVLYHLPGPQLQFTPHPDGIQEGHVDFVALVFDQQGLLVNSLHKTVDMNLKPATYARVTASGMDMLLKIAVPEKGSYFLRAGVHDRSSGRSGALEVSTGEIQTSPAPPPPAH